MKRKCRKVWWVMNNDVDMITQCMYLYAQHFFIRSLIWGVTLLPEYNCPPDSNSDVVWFASFSSDIEQW